MSSPLRTEEHSPKLKGTLRRLLPDTERKAVESFFLLAIQFGGLEELDYIREEGQSFNPRPARILSILIDQANQRSPLVLSAASVASVWSELPPETQARIPSEVAEVAEQAAHISRTIMTEEHSKRLKPAILIALASYLDRARHLHLADASIWREVYEESTVYIDLAEEHCHPLHPLLVSWKLRFAKQQLSR